jgi:hypothetical protein
MKNFFLSCAGGGAPVLRQENGDGFLWGVDVHQSENGLYFLSGVCRDDLSEEFKISAIGGNFDVREEHVFEVAKSIFEAWENC